MASDAESVAELFRSLGPVRRRRMFGGCGVYAGEIMFALEAGGVFFLKSDESTRAAFEAEGCGPFSYQTRQGRRTATSYWRIPDRLLDDPDELAAWARRAIEVASRRPAKRRAALRRPAA
jgi:DNA transformation protein